MSIYEFVVKDNKGNDFHFDTLKGKVIMIVNTASKCGFTPQYKDLEALYQKHKDEGFEIIAFPCNQFLSQEPGTDEEIASFCSLNYGVTFPIMKKINVNGEYAADIYKFLKEKESGFLGSAIKWNFTKFLISRDGKKIKRYAPTTNPSSIEKDVVEFIKEQ
ncbi:Glutathione peroxidase, putative [Trichomonas vaginalis G3]|uniref:Glutathione peroxidase n=1 Tax=Trichomonas vaginalis (strain ATCC PRA-98 / G3) TaxID=412133 RepID=A2GIZ8_TRIV3|nr:glutathione peroxidase protein [Trichomonas vaginalis G3]EAX82870.1 Glutathione peroxidase, putative [Trichomonas vaginalis G3]KAI5509686.1 glutathione peroxidase protein [Trichomonas vaginalis G3]|eukprot:XP_001295800.1 Glutathione peroxidase [Trichomonas vaginalis G3]